MEFATCRFLQRPNSATHNAVQGYDSNTWVHAAMRLLTGVQGSTSMCTEVQQDQQCAHVVPSSSRGSKTY